MDPNLPHPMRPMRIGLLADWRASSLREREDMLAGVKFLAALSKGRVNDGLDP